jgi:hypothetical protein
MGLNIIPDYPFTKPSEFDAYKDWENLLNKSFLNLLEKKNGKAEA